MKKQLVMITFLSLALAIFTAGIGTAQTAEDTIEIIVESSQDSGSGTLRDALQRAKAGTVIKFSEEVFPKDTPVAIQVLSGLPPLTTGFITIDASDTGVILDGNRLNHGKGLNGLEIFSNNNIVMGLQIINFPKLGIGIMDGAQENRIGGTDRGEGNVIGANYDGIEISGTDTAYNHVIGNFIGTDATGTIANGNKWGGIWIGGNAHDNVIGGEFDTEGNLISGNVLSGIVLDNTSGNLVAGNIIGLDAEGVQPLGNGTGGIVIIAKDNNSAVDNIIGGLEPSNRNVISANNGIGILLEGRGTTGNKVIGNDIGLKKNSRNATGNSEEGVLINNGAHHNEIGPGNRIAFNEANGILTEGEETFGNIITRNSIYENKGMAIRNSNGGNLEINPPEISQVSSRIVRGSAEPNQLIEVFSDNDDECGSFEGETITDKTGAFFFLIPSGSFQNRFVTATVRGEDGSTSELSERMENAAFYIGRELPNIVAPAQVSTEPAVVGTNLALASAAVVFFGFTSTALNDILKNYTSDISAALGRLIPTSVKSFFRRDEKSAWPSSDYRRKFTWMWIVIVLVNAVIESFLDPAVPLLGYERLSVIVTIFAAGLVVSGLEWISDHYSHKLLVKTAVPHSEIQTAGLLLGVASVVFSRLMRFTPGYLYGIVGVIYLLPKITGRKESGQRALLVQSSIFIGGLILWGFSALLPEKLLWMEPFMLTAFLISLQGVLFELIPIDMFDGSDLWKWRKGVWGLFFALVFFCFFHFMLNPAGSDIQALQQNSIKTLLIVMVIFGSITLISWLLLAKTRKKN